ncbi:hypothetical protein VPH35_041377 [Triticum aestivum]|uniref:Uncharacterized protein n=1 Tax=Aegilops tauschii TaxID=37682 RepID=M8D4D6_AEGTA
METLDPCVLALDLATEAVDATSGGHMGGGLLTEGEPGGGVDGDRGGGVRAAVGRAGGGPVGAAGAGGRGGQASPVAGRATRAVGRRQARLGTPGRCLRPLQRGLRRVRRLLPGCSTENS